MPAGFRLLLVALALGPLAHVSGTGNREWMFRSLDGVKVVNGRAEIATYRGRHAVHLIASPAPDGEAIAILAGSDSMNGTIEADVAGAPRADADESARGFVGIAFRVQSDERRFENLYLRPTNGRAEDQERRNHSAQYTSEPEFPWERLRKESPARYESYVDLEPGAWTSMKIVMSGRRVALYVNGASQPCLIVNDLKLGETHGSVALWAHSTTDAYFSRVVLRAE
jgi:hypothetical protein